MTGLSTTQGTRIEVTCTFKQAQAAGAYMYFDHPGGYRAGTSLIVADATLMSTLRTTVRTITGIVTTRMRRGAARAEAGGQPIWMQTAGWFSTREPPTATTGGTKPAR